MADHVFAYGSLAIAPALSATSPEPVGALAALRGMRRGWGVAMDNRVDLPGYKCYLGADGERPAVSVCFLDIDEDPAPGARVNGVCLPVRDGDLAALDRRERNYERIDVSERIELAGRDGRATGRRVWAYRGSPAGRARFRAALADGTAVIQDAYLQTVRAGFRALGPGAWEACERSLDPGPIPVLELVRRELA